MRILGGGMWTQYVGENYLIYAYWVDDAHLWSRSKVHWINSVLKVKSSESVYKWKGFQIVFGWNTFMLYYMRKIIQYKYMKKKLAISNRDSKA